MTLTIRTNEEQDALIESVKGLTGEKTATKAIIVALKYYDLRHNFSQGGELKVPIPTEVDAPELMRAGHSWDIIPPPPKPAGPANTIINPRGPLADFFHRVFA